MKLYELLEAAVKTGDILYDERTCETMRYYPKFECFVWCGLDGFIDEWSAERDKASLRPSLFSHEWHLQPLKKDKIIGSLIIDGSSKGFRIEYQNGESYSLEDILNSKHIK